MLFFLSSMLLVGALAYVGLKIRPDAQRTRSNSMVRVYCASGIAKPVEELIANYNESYDAHVEIVRTGGSGELAGQIKTEFETGLIGGADIYITADDLMLAKAFSEGIIAERFSLAVQKPVIATAANSELGFDSISELVHSDGIKYGIASERAAVGRMIRQIAKRDGVLAELESNKATDSENVMTLAQALVAGSLDAAVIWDTTVSQVNQTNQLDDEPILKIAAVADPSSEFQSNIAIGIVSTTKTPTEGLKFARYLTAPETSRMPFEKYGFSFIDGDTWEEVPEIHLYCGSMFTPVLEETVREFASREGVNIYPRWEGCGKLVASMNAIEDPNLFPDAYLACDIMFLEEVKDRFNPAITMSNNQIVMAARKNLKAAVLGPGDLLDLDLRIGICDPTQSALGRLTKQMLSSQPYEGLYEELEKKASVTVDVGPTLMSQLLAGGLDIAFVYRSNVLANPESLDTLRIIEVDERSKTALATPAVVDFQNNQECEIDGSVFCMDQPPQNQGAI